MNNLKICLLTISSKDQKNMNFIIYCGRVKFRTYFEHEKSLREHVSKRFLKI